MFYNFKLTLSVGKPQANRKSIIDSFFLTANYFYPLIVRSNSILVSKPKTKENVRVVATIFFVKTSCNISLDWIPQNKNDLIEKYL